MARPAKKLDFDQLEALMRLKPTAEDAAAFFKCSVDTIERRIKEHTATKENPSGLSFAEFREQNMVATRMMLVRTALNKAGKGDNTMLIFCLKNLNGWQDKAAEVSVNVTNNVPASISKLSDEELKTRLADKIKKMGPNAS